MASRVDASDGWTADQLFNGSTGPISFDDVVILPGAASVQESAINCAAKLTKRSPVLNVPIVGGPSEAVVGADMAIALALAGGSGVRFFRRLHRCVHIGLHIGLNRRSYKGVNRREIGGRAHNAVEPSRRVELLQCVKPLQRVHRGPQGL